MNSDINISTNNNNRVTLQVIRNHYQVHHRKYCSVCDQNHKALFLHSCCALSLSVHCSQIEL